MNSLFRTSITIISLLIATNVWAQDFIRSGSIEVRENDKPLKYAWAGGLNNPQFSNADLNNNGIEDLVIFDRKDHQFLTFLTKGTTGEIDFEYVPKYENYFPKVGNWALLVDYNCDGIKDIFSSLLQIPNNFNNAVIHEGYYENDELKFKEDVYTIYFTNEAGEKEEVFIPLYDVPGIQDIDDDGDIDILTFNNSGGYLEYYKNLSMENTGNCGALDFIFEDECYGKFFEPAQLQRVFLSDDPNMCSPRIGKREEFHPGSTILAIDTDEDADKELFLGDISWDNINILYNHGDLNKAYMAEQDTMFPSYDIPILFNYFPGIYYVDVNNDNIRDFIAAPNGPNNSVNFKCSWLYLNKGADNKLVASFKQDDFLVEEMIDVGEQSRPVFFDYNVDGLLDLLVANAGYYIKDGFVDRLKNSLNLFENVGTKEKPIFELVTRDYLNLDYLRGDNFKLESLHPAFADLDNDGDEDMLLGDGDGFVHFFKNDATSGQVANFTLYKAKFGGIDANQQARPFLYDVTGNGLFDLVIGTRSSPLYYYENIGTPEEADYIEVSNDWGKVNIRELGEVTAYSSPVLMELGEDKELTLLLGSESGKIYAFNQIVENIDSGAFNLITDNFLNETTGLFSSFTIGNIENDPELEMIVGNNRGGLSLYNGEIFVPINEAPTYLTFQVFPNPVNEQLTIKSDQAGLSHFQLINVSGQLIYENTFMQQKTLSIKSYPNGIYFLKIKQKDVVKMAKLIIQK